MVPDLTTALRKESDALAGSELADALIDIAGGVDPVVREAIGRFPQPLATTTWLTLLRRAPAALPLHPSLNREAIVAMSRWRFHPATQDGRPVPIRAVVEMEFVLRK